VLDPTGGERQPIRTGRSINFSGDLWNASATGVRISWSGGKQMRLPETAKGRRIAPPALAHSTGLEWTAGP
jgi:hypothetical protein